MDKLLAVIRREYVETVRTKAFVISTLLVPVLMTAMMFLPQMLARSSSDEKLRLGVADRTSKVFDLLERELSSDQEKDFLKSGQRRYELVEATPDQIARLDETQVPGAIIKEMEVDALVDVGPEAISGEELNQKARQPRYYSTNVGDFEPIRRVEGALNSVVVAVRLEGTSVTPEQIRSVTKEIDLQPEKVGTDGRAGKRGFLHEWLTALFVTIGLYTTTLMAGMALSRGLLEEKGNRVIEVLISSVTPFQLMTGKILGHALVITTQLVIWGLMGAAFYLQGLGGEDARIVLGALNPSLLAYLVVYFLLGYFLYAALFAGVGAVCTTEMEAQQTQTPLVLLQILPFLIAMAIVRQPNSSMAVMLSMIPFFSPSVMMMRMALQPPPLIQIIASIAILVISVILAFWAVSKIFRVGILMTGKRMTLPEMMRWLRAA